MEIKVEEVCGSGTGECGGGETQETEQSQVVVRVVEGKHRNRDKKQVVVRLARVVEGRNRNRHVAVMKQKNEKRQKLKKIGS